MTTKIEALRAEIDRLNDLYYNKGESDQSDEVYDSLKRQLRELEGESDDPLSPINKVGASSDGGFEKVKHLSPMLSLQNKYDEQELTDWLVDLGRPMYASLEYKLDGASMSLRYHNGKLKAAVTRGDGEEGDDITENAIHFEGVPQDIGKFPGDIEFRGECIVPRHFFDRACERRAARGKKTYANPRNMVAGLMRSHEGEGLVGMGIQFIAYDCIVHAETGPNYIAFDDIEDHVSSRFLQVHSVWKGLTSSVDQIMDHINAVSESRDKIDYDIDGMVVKLIVGADRTAMGARTTSPRWAVAYKFEAQTTTSVLESIEVQVGRTGVITPVAKISPVKLCGVTISSVTLHNYEEVKRLDLRIGDTVVVSRRGDVIPKIESVVTSLRVDEHGTVIVPAKCPCCDAELKSSNSGIELFCTNAVTCPAQVVNKMSYFVSRDGIDVKHLGPAAVESLIVTGVLGSFSSLFYLREEDFYAAGIGEAMTDKIMASISAAKTLPFFKVLRAVGIPDLGDSTARSIAAKFPSFHALLSSSDEDLLAIADVGPETVKNIRTIGDAAESDMTSLDKILTYVQPVSVKADVQDLAGKTVVVTGSDFDGKSRKEMEADVIARGAKLTKSVSKNTDIVFAGKGAGPDKLIQARSLDFFTDGIMLVNPNSKTRIVTE